MKTLQKFTTALLLAASTMAYGQDPWLHIYYDSEKDYKAFDMTKVLEITFDEEAGTMVINAEDGTTTVFQQGEFNHFRINPNVARIDLIANDPDAVADTTWTYDYSNAIWTGSGWSYQKIMTGINTEVKSKKVYVDGTMKFSGRGLQDDYEMDVRFRGRGNSTWGYPKKAYRLKFSEKQRMLLPKKAKNFVLLANYIDPSLMRNFAAYKFGEVIDMPWVNHCEPVDVYLNNVFKGSYMLTGKVGFNNGSVNLKAADEPNSIMFEIDNNSIPSDNTLAKHKYFKSDSIYFGSDDVIMKSIPFLTDEDYCILPLKLKDPDMPEDTVAAIAWLKEWRADFNKLVAAVAEGNEQKIFELCDVESLARYVMVFDFACNQEIDHPKSVYVYKTKGGKWQFGPCWDFDWAFGYRPTYGVGSTNGSYATQTMSYQNPLLSYGHHDASNMEDGNTGLFFYKMCKTKTFQDCFDRVWSEFMAGGKDKFWADFNDYVERLRPSANAQFQLESRLQSYTQFDYAVESLRSWLEGRIDFINSDPNRGLWEDGVFNKY